MRILVGKQMTITLHIVKTLLTGILVSSLLVNAQEPITLTSTSRGINQNLLSFDTNFGDAFSYTSPCTNYTSSSTNIRLSHPTDLQQDDTYFGIARDQLIAAHLVIDYVNLERCGINIDNGAGTGNAMISLDSFGDNSNTKTVELITTSLLENTDFFLGPYASGLTAPQSRITNEAKKILLAGGAATTSVFADRPFSFGTFPPTSKYMASAIELLAQSGAKSVAAIWEAPSFTKGVCAALQGLTQIHDMTLDDTQEVKKDPELQDFLPVAQRLKEKNPDVVVTCVYDAACSKWITAMRQVNWSPKAQVFTICVGLEYFESQVSYDAQFMIGVTPWDKSLKVTDAVTGWSANDFHQEFSKFKGQVPTYHAASSASTVSILVQAIEQAGPLQWNNSSRIAEILSTSTFPTMYGIMSFDENGQSSAPSLATQYDSNGIVQTVYPKLISSGDLIYPMPTWLQRDCTNAGSCTEFGVCNRDGVCECEDAGFRSYGIGEDATCVPFGPGENYNYLSSGLLALGYSLVALQGVFSFICIFWTLYFAKRSIVKTSQPVFLIMIALGCFMIVLSIIPTGIQGGYRYVKDDNTGLETEELNDSIPRLDAACMAWPWVYFLGFSLTFASLFAKLWRIKKVFSSAEKFRRTVVSAKDVFYIIVIIVGLNVTFLLIWQFVAPLQWHRKVLGTAFGFATESVGECRPKNNWGWYLAIPPLAFEIIVLLYSLFISYQTRKVPSGLAERKWILFSVGAIFELALLGVPILVISRDNSSTYYFVRAAILFLQGFTVSVLIFVPKILMLHFSAGAKASSNSRFSRNPTRFDSDMEAMFRTSTLQSTTHGNEGFNTKRNSNGFARCQDCRKLFPTRSSVAGADMKPSRRGSQGSVASDNGKILNEGTASNQEQPKSVRRFSRLSSRGESSPKNESVSEEVAVKFEAQVSDDDSEP
jgi:ABC-type branched-subunit amino acid transport system substrate-binding protein